MYSEEIKKLLLMKNNLVTVDEYYCIVNSPQIEKVRYCNQSDNFEVITSDGYSFNLRINKNVNKIHHS